MPRLYCLQCGLPLRCDTRVSRTTPPPPCVHWPNRPSPGGALAGGVVVSGVIWHPMRSGAVAGLMLQRLLQRRYNFGLFSRQHRSQVVDLIGGNENGGDSRRLHQICRKAAIFRDLRTPSLRISQPFEANCQKRCHKMRDVGCLVPNAGVS